MIRYANQALPSCYCGQALVPMRIFRNRGSAKPDGFRIVLHCVR